MQRHDRGEPAARDHGGDDLGGEPAVRLQHPLKRRLIEGGAAVGLNDLVSLDELAHHRLVAQVNRPLVDERGNTGGERLVRDRKCVLAGYVLSERDAAGADGAQ